MVSASTHRSYPASVRIIDPGLLGRRRLSVNHCSVAPHITFRYTPNSAPGARGRRVRPPTVRSRTGIGGLVSGPPPRTDHARLRALVVSGPDAGHPVGAVEASSSARDVPRELVQRVQAVDLVTVALRSSASIWCSRSRRRPILKSCASWRPDTSRERPTEQSHAMIGALWCDNAGVSSPERSSRADGRHGAPRCSWVPPAAVMTAARRTEVQRSGSHGSARRGWLADLGGGGVEGVRFGAPVNKVGVIMQSITGRVTCPRPAP